MLVSFIVTNEFATIQMHKTNISKLGTYVNNYSLLWENVSKPPELQPSTVTFSMEKIYIVRHGKQMKFDFENQPNRSPIDARF